MAVLPNATRPADDPVTGDNHRPAVILEGVTRMFRERGDHDEKIAIDNVSLTVPVGQTVAITGPTGSGKSTLLDLIAGIERPDAGTVIVGGVPVASLSSRRAAGFRRRIGFVSGDAELVTALTVLDNVVFPLLLERTGAWRRRADRHRRALELLDAVGLGRVATARVGQLAAVHRRQVAVARAMVTRPALVLADEPTNGLDRDSAARVLDDLLRLIRQQGGTLVLATRDDSIAVRCRRVIALQDGSFLADHVDDTRPKAVRRWIDRPAPLL